jgi:type I restriction enzyme S subunit
MAFFLDNFQVLADAPNGIKHLREMILQLAVMGKLVPRDPDDEPAALLLEKIKKEKDRLIKSGKIKKQKPLPPIKEEEIPYEIPKGWVWVRMRDICHDWGQKKPDKKFTYIDVASIDQKKGIISNNTQLLAPENAPSRARKIVKKDTVIYSTVRPYLLNIAIIEKHVEPEPIASTAFAILHTFSGVYNQYIYHYLRSAPFITYVEEQMIGVAYPAINDAKFFSGLLPLPPLNEQKRIVQRVDRLMTLCDELEKKKEKKIKKQVSLNNASLEKLLSSRSPEEFQDRWRLIADNFDVLYADPDNVAKLKQAVLQLAVMGKLVPQDPDDEPASLLLEKIKKEKERLIKAGKIKKPKPLPPIKKEEIPYELPKGWVWAYLDNVAEIVRGGSPRPARDPMFYGGNIPFLKVADLTSDSDMYLHSHTYTIKKTGLKKTRYVSANTLMLTNSGATLGVPKICCFDTTINDGIAAFLHVPDDIYIPYLYFFLKSRTKWFLDFASRGQGQPNLNTDIIKTTLLPLPPAIEQHRIVSRVEELLDLCDGLEETLRKAATKSEQLCKASGSFGLVGVKGEDVTH